jgi:hypothetical protein
MSAKLLFLVNVRVKTTQYYGRRREAPQPQRGLHRKKRIKARAMALLEIITSLICTYAASEWLHGTKRRALIAACAAALAQAAAAALRSMLPILTELSVLPDVVKVPVVAVCFLGLLYVDTVVRSRRLNRDDFIGEVGAATLRLLPLFPLFSLVIAFALLEVGEACERMGLPTAWLNGPIYYGMFYGPFAYVYISVKAVAKASTLLPLARQRN